MGERSYLLSKRSILFWCIFLLGMGSPRSYAQTFNFNTTEASEIVSGTDLNTFGFPATPETLAVWCNDWDRIQRSPSTWGDTFKIKSNNSFVKFYIDHYSLFADYNTPVNYTYRLAYTIMGYTNPYDTTSISSYVTYSDTLAASYNNDTLNTPFQDLNSKKYSNFYKIVVVLTGILKDSAGILSSVDLSDPALRNFKVEASILTQHYDKMPYGIGSTPPAIDSAYVIDDQIQVSWTFDSKLITPSNFELEWTYVDDYKVSPYGGISSPFTASSLSYNFRNNSTRVSVSNIYQYLFPFIYSSGYVVFRVRAVRPDSILYKYPIYSGWSIPDSGNIGSLDNVNYKSTSGYLHDSLNWQYTVSFAEGGKYKNVASFFDGLLKNRQSITRFNSTPGNLLVTNNIYDYEGQSCIKTLPAVVNTGYFSYQHNIDLNSLTHNPYQASDFDSGLAVCPYYTIPPFDTTALASIYYSKRHPDSLTGADFIPDAQGYPFVQTIFEPGYAERVSAQGGAGGHLQIGDSNNISNYYVSPSSLDLNALFGPNVGWSSFYTMTVSQDPNQQLSMSIKDYEGRQMASAMIGAGPNPTTHAITSIGVPSAIYYKQDVLLPQLQNQFVDTLAGTRTADVLFYNEVQGSIDSIQYLYSFTPFQACPGNYISVKGHYDCYITDQCGDVILRQDTVLGVDGLVSGGTPLNYVGPVGTFSAWTAPYHVHKTLSFSDADVNASLDSLFDSYSNCFLTEPYFIKKSVDSAKFPCTGMDNGDSSACAKMKMDMMKQLLPNALYGKYSIEAGHVVGTGNSIFSIDCPPDTFHVARYHPDSTQYYCYTPHGFFYCNYYAGGDLFFFDDPSNLVFELPDTCVGSTNYTSFATIILYVPVNLDSIKSISDDSTGNIYGNLYLKTNSDSIGLENGAILNGGSTIASITSNYSALYGCYIIYINFPVTVSHDTIGASIIGILPRGDSINIQIAAMTTITDSTVYDSIVSGYGAGTCGYSPLLKYRYQDSCTVPSLPDSITVNGIKYRDLREMPADSFIMVYNGAIAEGDYSIAEALLPLHPQYCELQNCFDDTFKTQVEAIPNWQVAASLDLLYLDSIVAHDPLKALMTSSGLFPNPADTLRTFPGGIYSLDTFILMNAYCSCNDPVMFNQCVANMFSNEISSHLLINAAVKKYYFSSLINTYFSNRQKYVDAILMRGSPGCAHCALARMNLDAAGALPPADFASIDSAAVHDTHDTTMTGTGTIGWFSHISSYSDSEAYDSALVSYRNTDSLLTYGEIDTMIAHLSNCIAGNATISTGIKDTLISIFRSGAAPSGNFTFQQILHALNTNGVSMTDICNPYIINCYQFGTPPPVPVNDCRPPGFFAGLDSFLNLEAVQEALFTEGTPFSGTLDTVGNSFERELGRALGNQNSTGIMSVTNSTFNLYVLKVYNTTSGDTVQIGFHSPSGMIFSTGWCYGSAISASCINSTPSLISSSGMINEYSFTANVTLSCYAGEATYPLAGWIDSIPTMTYMDNGLAACIPCTQIRQLYNQFSDTLLAYGIKGTDHPYYDVMLANFMNYNLQQQYSGGDYETFIQSCALADSLRMPVYTGYSTFRFASTSDMNSFMGMINNIDPLYSFSNSYRDSTVDSSIITVCVNLNSIPLLELWRYRDTLENYAGPYRSKNVDQPLSAVQRAGEIGFIYFDSSTYPFNPADSSILSDTLTVKFRGPYRKGIWMDGKFVVRDFYDIVADSATPPYTISRDIYSLAAYVYNKGIPGAVFTPEFMSTINADYFKPEKQAFLSYTYGYQSLPEYQVIDSEQAQFLISRISSYSGYFAGYSQASTPGVFSNLYLSNSGMSSRLYDTLQAMVNGVSSSGHIFESSNDVEVSIGSPRQLTAIVCGDGSYWYRYFSTGDTLYDAFVSFPAYIPRYIRSSYFVAGPVIPVPGDSLNRCFMLKVVRTGTTDTLLLGGRTDFVIGKSIQLSDVLLGQTPGGVNVAGADTFDNCERQILRSAISEGIVSYNNYIDSVQSRIRGAFRSYVASAVTEHLWVGYMNDEFDYTLYNYDRAGNLDFTVSPGGNTPIPNTGTLLDSVDHMRDANTPGLSPAPTYTKQNRYQYNTFNKVQQQATVDGGKTRFFYDLAGRLIFSQNARQALNGYYTYNIYDKQSRAIQTGEALLGCPYFDTFSVSSLGGVLPACYNDYAEGSNYLISPDPYFVQNIDRVPYDSVVWYLGTFQRDDVVMTVYDTAATNLAALAGLDAQQNLRKRVAAVKYFDTLTATDVALDSYTYATHYSYDMDGNVQTLTQDFPDLAVHRRQYIRIDYDYDLISGKVNMLSYNRGSPDQFYQRYSYDADNRITEVETSADGYNWSRDAAYTYYEHGPLLREELGDLRVQGIDYAYTIQGWLKAVNGDTLKATYDMGRDGLPGSIVAKDAVAYTIDYFADDYEAYSTRVQNVTPVSRSLYNGNISRQTVAINNFQRLNKQYVYDQLNRIHGATYASVSSVGGTLMGLTDYKNHYSYGPDGNILSLVRYKNNTGSGAPLMDSLIYQYTSGQVDNKLQQLYDMSTDRTPGAIAPYTGPSTPARYRYDPIGNTVGDLVSGQDTIEWNLYNKVTRTVNNSDTSTMVFKYDGAGNRVSKTYTKTAPNSSAINADYYVHDAQGNVLAIYHGKQLYYFYPVGVMANNDFSLAEHTIYGSSRLGVKDYYPDEVGYNFVSDYADTARFWARAPWYSLEYQDVITPDSTNLYGNAFTDMSYEKHILGQKQYELTDHLGDVLATISDRRLADSLTGPHSMGALDTIQTYKPVVVSATDYYPFGMQMPGRYMSDTATHSFNTTLVESIPYFISSYFPFSGPYPAVSNVGSGYSVILLSGDLLLTTTSTGDGLTMTIDSLDPYASQTITLVTGGSSSLLSPVAYTAQIISVGSVLASCSVGDGGTFAIPFTPDATSVTLTITQTSTHSGTLDLLGIYVPRFDSFVTENVVTTVSDEDKYHYGYNGQMKDNQWAGVGNHTTAEFWEYDTRTGKRANRDPISNPSLSDYSTFGDNPISNADPNGDYFFGLFGSTGKQRRAAKTYQKEHGGETIDKTKSDIHNHNLAPNDSHGSDDIKYGIVASGPKDHYFTPDGHSGGSSCDPEMNEVTDHMARDDDYQSRRTLAGDRPFGTFDYEMFFLPLPPVLKILSIAPKIEQGIGFASFAEFKAVYGKAGSGMAWHHIVEQNPTNIARFGPEAIHNTNNLIKIEHGAGTLHSQVSGYYSSKFFFTNGQTVRQWLSTQSYEQQYDFGIKILKQFGWKP